MKNLEKQAMAIVAQLFDLAEVPVKKRQEINDVAYDYVTEQLIITDVSVSCCNNCKHFGFESPSHDQPYPEFWCSKKHWDGIENPDELHEPIECIDFVNKQSN